MKVYNEAVELSKRYGEDKARAFVNGVLASIVRDIEANTEIEASSIDDKSPKPWIDIQTSALETKIGIHTYSFTFLNTLIGHRMCLYSSYIIRSNHPDKPYIYIDAR